MRQEAGFAQQARMPVGGPAFVHDLASEDRVKVEGFFAHRQEDVAFPLGQFRPVLRDEPQQVALGPGRQGRTPRAGVAFRRNRLPGQMGVAVVEGVGRRFGRRVQEFRIARAVQGLVDVDVRFERERGVEHGLDPLLPMGGERRFQPVRPSGALFQDVAAGHVEEAPEQHVVLGKIGMTQHVGGDQGVLGQRIMLEHEGAARLAREHHLEDARMPHVLAHQLVDVAYAEGPVAHPHR